jgi:adenine-specific DNA-methyltransferase
MFYPIFYDPKTGDLTINKDQTDSGYIEIWPIDENGIDRRWRWGKNMFMEKWQTETEVKKVGGEYRIYTKDRMKGEKPKTIWIRPEYSGASGTTDVKNLLGKKVFAYPKSVTLVKDSVQVSTDKNDIVLDFFGGSGTTAHAVMEQNKEDSGRRKFILVEQMDYIHNVTAKRIGSAIKNYYPNESFCFLELKKYNQEFVDKINAAKSFDELNAVFDEMKKNAFLKFWFDSKDLEERFKNEDTFRNLDKQKQALVEILDENQLYLNYADMNDAKYNVSADEKELTNRFYQEHDTKPEPKSEAGGQVEFNIEEI